jgi:hypothetical protein
VISRLALIAPLVLASAVAIADDDPEMRSRLMPADRGFHPSGCVARVMAQYAPPEGERADAARRRAERLGAAVYARCGLPR